jgi:hypothetical protein
LDFRWMIRAGLVIRGQPQRPVHGGELFGPGGFPGSGESDHQEHRGGARVLLSGSVPEWFFVL